MNKNYELTLLARPDVSDEDLKLALQTLRDIIISNSNTIFYAEYWGLRQLEYPISKNNSAHFYMIQYNADKDTNNILEEKIKTSEIFIRHLLLNIDEEDLKVKSSNSVSATNNQEEGVVVDKRFLNIVSDIFNIKG